MEYLLNEVDGFETWKIDDGLVVYRRLDKQPWVTTINRSGLIKRHKFYSIKNSAMVHGSSTGEGAFFRYLDAHPWVAEFRPQGDLLHFVNSGGSFWALPDAVIIGANDQIIYGEGKYMDYTTEKQWNRFDQISRELARRGLVHNVFDQGWCIHPTVFQNLQIVKRNRHILPNMAGRAELLELIGSEPTSMSNAAELLSSEDPDFNQVFAAMGRRELQFNINLKVTDDTLVYKPMKPDWAVNGHCEKRLELAT